MNADQGIKNQNLAAFRVTPVDAFRWSLTLGDDCLHQKRAPQSRETTKLTSCRSSLFRSIVIRDLRALLSRVADCQPCYHALMSIQADNHYVPRLYLKRFAASPGRVFVYRLLVPDARKPLWQERAIKGIAYHPHLYTRIAASGETDEIEKWLNAAFETPAEEALAKATSGARLTPSDWNRLIRFLAAQDVRTPARFAEELERWKGSLPGILDDTLQATVRQLEAAHRSGQPVNVSKQPYSDYIPLGITKQLGSDKASGRLQVETVLGRGLWFFSMKHVLTSTIEILHGHRWSILTPPDGLRWFTSDNPVVRLNYYSDGTYDFKGGWGKIGTEIFLPLSPRHLMYTQVGSRKSRGRCVATHRIAHMIRRFIAEHAHRFVYSAFEDREVPRLRKRSVDAERLQNENEQWRRWHEAQTAAEKQVGVSNGLP